MINKLKASLQREFFKNFILLIFANFLGRGIGFIKEMFIANYFGISINLDIIIFSYSLAATLMMILSGGLENTVLPKYLYYKNNNPKEKDTYLFAAFTIFVLIIFVLYIIVYFFGEKLILFMSPGFSLFDQMKAYHYLKIFFIYIVFAFLSTYFMILIKAEKYFFFSGIVTSFIPSSILVFVLFAHDLGIKVIAYGIVVGSFLQLFFSWMKIRNYFTLKIKNFDNIKNKYKDILRNYFILLGSGLFVGLIGLTDQTFATIAGEGGVSSLNYAMKLPMLLDGLVLTVLGTILFSSFSENAAHFKYKENKQLYLKSLKYSFLILFPMVLIFSFFSRELIAFVFMRGKFDLNSLILVYPIQIAFFLKLPFFAIAVISARMMNTLYLNKEMLFINISTFILNGILDYFFVIKYGVLGIAFSTFFVYVLAAVLNYYITVKKLNQVNDMRKI